jgi:hypothetical protein
MSRARQHFRQTDVTKAVKAVAKAGVPVGRVEISPEGHIIVIAGAPGQGQNTDQSINEWDTVVS